MSILISKMYINDLQYAVKNTDIFDELKNERILITGATGLIGSGITDLLLMANWLRKLNIKIFVASRDLPRAKKRFNDFPDDFATKWITYVEYDATKPNKLDFCVDYIIHAASNAHPRAFVESPVDTMMCNISGLNELLKYAKINAIKNILYVSSSEVYGRNDTMGSIRENEYGYLDILNSRNAYASSKRAGETLCSSYYKQFGVKSNIVRPGHIYGPTASEEDSRVGSSFAYNAALGKNIVMKSNGKQIRSYCYVLDCATAILTVLARGKKTEAYNISNRDSIISIKELAELYAIEGDVNVEYKLPTDIEKASFNPMDNSSLDSTKLESLGWRGIFNPKIGTSHTISALKEKFEKCGKYCQ